jgi:NAD(P)-dependent dehydrogenase (short-subunit alcohol dehydrogenase family)
MALSTVLITGAASGIGRAAAQHFAANHWCCVLVDRDAPGLALLSKTLPGHSEGAHRYEVADLTSPSDLQALAGKVPALDALINNAGMSDSRNLSMVAQTTADLDRLLALNWRAPAALIEALTARLKPGARIVNVASGAGLRAIPWRGAYSASKAGLIAQSQALARARPDLCVTVLCPGFVRTELVDGLIAAGRLRPEGAVAKIPLGRMADPQEMATALGFLASSAAAPLTGQVLALDGGSSVFGGSQACAPAVWPPMPWDAPLALTVEGSAPESGWPQPSLHDALAYRACLSWSLDPMPPGDRWNWVHQAAVRFAAQYGQQASLTLLLPVPSTVPWADAGETAAMRMLIATLACEWGANALRINALELPPGMTPQQVAPVVQFVAGAGAQYLTGQTWSLTEPLLQRSA